MRARHLPDWVRVPESVSGTTASFDGYLSSDGPFGVFAHPVPNETHTIIGGPDLVAVDWVGASKMGIDPLLSPYLKHAVEIFGKPEIQLVGDANPAERPRCPNSLHQQRRRRRLPLWQRHVLRVRPDG